MAAGDSNQLSKLDVRFADAALAARNLARIRAAAPPRVMRSLEILLTDSPDPDAALNQFDRLVENSTPELLRSLEQNPVLVHYAMAVFAHSQWLGETLVQNPDLFVALERDRGLNRSHAREDFRDNFAHYRSRSMQTDPALLLARFKRREYVRILLRDVLGIAPLAETTAELSALADVLIAEALREADAQLRARHGAPQHVDSRGRLADTGFAVLALGKLGGNEVNYSSDVDLLYLYQADSPPDAAFSNREYFIRLAQQVTEILSRQTQEGMVFRIDLRLRPMGHEGEPAVALDAALRYYALTAHDWELQAMIKARHAAGDQPLARQFLRAVQPQVYRPEINFAAIKTALLAREKIGTRRRYRQATDPAQSGIDVKLDHGGIRDIEFLVQCLQRVYGGAEPWLRSCGTLFSLSKLHDKGHISGKDFHELNSAYEFLRKVEHRLQLRRGQQTHRLPGSAAELRSLFRSVCPDEAHDYDPQRFLQMVQQRMAAVANIYQRVIYRNQAAEGEAGQPQAASVRDRSAADIAGRLAADSPALHALATRSDLDPAARRNLLRFLSAALTDADRYAVLLRAPQAVERALPLFRDSDYFTELLVRHPEEIAIVSAPLETAARGEAAAAGLEAAFQPVLHAELSHTEKLALLRRQYRHSTAAVAAADLLHPAPLYESLGRITAVAEEAIRTSLALVNPAPGFAVMALGRLGTHEFDIASDADLVFVRDEHADATETRRTAEQLLQALTAYTREGTLFPVDVRLRPHGAEGELVVTPTQMRDYFVHEGRAWEALSYTKVRWVAGSQELAAEAESLVTAQLRHLARDPGFTAQVLEMRQKLEASDTRPLNYKTGMGGFYDVDFVVSWIALHITPAPAAPVAQELERLAKIGELGADDYAALRQGADFYRSVDHAARLVTGRGRKALPAGELARQRTAEVAQRILNRSFHLENELWDPLESTCRHASLSIL